MAGTWRQTKGPKGRPGIYVQDTARGGKRYKVAYRDARGTVTSKTFERLEAAKDFQDQLGIRRRRNDLPDVSKTRMTLSELWEYLAANRDELGRGGRPIKPSTWASYEARWTKHITPRFAHEHTPECRSGCRKPNRRMGDLGRDDLKVFLKDLQSKTSLDTRRKVQQVLHKVLQVAVNEGWLTKNPLAGVAMPGAKVERDANALTEAEVLAIAAMVPDRYRALVWTLAETGMRVGEAVALRVKNLNGSIRIVENAPEVGGHRALGSPKTEASVRNVPISPRLRAILREHLEGVDAKGRPWVNRFDPESLVFTGERGAPVSQANFRKRVFQPAAERAKVLPNGEPPTVHDLRHTAISLWLTRGLTPFEVAKMVGHTDLKMIERRYGHMYEHALQEKIDRLTESGAEEVPG